MSLKELLEFELAEMDKRKKQQEEAITVMEQKRSEEKERARREALGYADREPVYETWTIPVSAQQPKMLIAGSARHDLLIFRLIRYSVCDYANSG